MTTIDIIENANIVEITIIDQDNTTTVTSIVNTGGGDCDCDVDGGTA